MKYDVYYHDDIDGRASAAVMLDFFISRGDKVGRFVPLNFDVRPKWAKVKFKNPAVIVDFLYHPKATFWFDHHPTTFMKKEWQEKFRPKKGHYLDASYLSACHLVIDMLRKYHEYKPSKNIITLGKQLDVVDGAKYRSARQIVEAREPEILLSTLVDYLNENRILGDYLIKSLSEKSIKDIVRDPKLRPLIRRYRAQQKQLLVFSKKKLLIDGKVSILPYTGMEFGGEIRFVPYYLYPKIHYALRVKKVGSRLFRIGFGHNPWHRGSHVDIGKFFKKYYGGGGHSVAGGGETVSSGSEIEVASKIIKNLRAYAQKHHIRETF